MKLVKREKGRYAIVPSYFSRALIAAAKATPGMKYAPGDHSWEGSPDAVTYCVALMRAAGLKLPVALLPPTPGDWGTPIVPVARKPLRDYQSTGVDFLISQGPTGAILADDMGLGKTCQAITAIRALNGKTLIVCPNYVRDVWVRELEKWWPAHGSVFLPMGVKDAKLGIATIPRETQIVICHYDILKAWGLQILEWAPRIFLVDECHALINENSERSKAARLIAGECEIRIGLSGTPIPNHVRDLWNVVDILSPGRFGNFFSFGLRYCDAHKEEVVKDKVVWKFDGASNLDELHSRLKYFMLRRTKSDVALQLPEKTRQVLWLDIPGSTEGWRTVGTNKQALRAALDRAADAKLPEASSIVNAHAAEGRHVVVFTWRKSVAEWLVEQAREEGLAADVIHGGLPVLRRNKTIEAAKLSKTGHLLVCTIDSTATGIDLSYADVAVFVELSWEPHKLLQGESRLHRFGQKNPVLIQYLIAKATGDELIVNTVLDKLDKFESAIGAVEAGKKGDVSASFALQEEDILADIYSAVTRQQEDLRKKKSTK